MKGKQWNFVDFGVFIATVNSGHKWEEKMAIYSTVVVLFKYTVFIQLSVQSWISFPNPHSPQKKMIKSDDKEEYWLLIITVFL